MEIPAPLAQLLQALDAGDLPAARTAAAALQRSGLHATQLAAEVLHELRQPLLGVKAYAQLLAEDGGPSGPLRLLMSQVERMEQIVSDFIRLASERHAPQQRLSLAAPIWAAAKLFSVNPDSARISLEVEAPEDISVQGNSRLIEQLTLNLLNNARDAMSGRGRVKVVLTREGSAPVLYVADWGPGIPDELRERIFEPYVTASKRGTGLGLAVCRRIAEEHHARIDLAPQGALRDVPAPATVFRVQFPASETAPGPRKRLLVVDDETIIRMVFRDLMGKECEVIEAASGEEALDLLREAPVDLIVTDKNLPGLSGLELAQQARRLSATSRVILMTGYPSLVTTQQALELGVVDYLLKPFDDIREVRTLLRSTLAAPPTQPGAAAQVKRVDVLEDNPATAAQIAEALELIGLEARVLPTSELIALEPPAGVVVSWDFAPAYGRKALELGKAMAQGAPFVVLAEHLTMETALESLRAGASACLPKLLSDTTALSRELSRAFKKGVP
ncbi:hybrid histidine protein kinase/response regulator SinK [Myxococcus sp. CA051A]|nr:MULTISPECIES: hybrid histidine protein kinase/response regulator SinK [Myxococcus]NTX01888.1 hybrid histidine protein kinase/response regulator SinK [Myxococcus sp. CA040A]NTX14624.1 hybrid histidine protein kinase/response regulator SinK [Myxococcus sp. CA056]NTX38716.1 hybrid histidine protein kinase/response regulator SinK [Myxococcus sp. CA033]NTX54138.1 hybrid histidine protein kinase/response regulator SinK [Myxococcus sp. CA039A]NTX62719.1 hybrid histidine protein kinase/response reg